MPAHATAYDGRWKRYHATALRAMLEQVHLEPGQRLIDIGSGTGLLLERLAQKYSHCELVGLELSADMMAVAQHRLRRTNVQLMLGSADELPYADASADVVTCTSVLHYLQNPARALQEMYRVLKPQGRIFLLDWNRDSWLSKFSEMYYQQFCKDHVRTYTTSEVEDFLARHGFAVVSTYRWQHSWWNLMLLHARKR